jgi:hypothetical protein
MEKKQVEKKQVEKKQVAKKVVILDEKTKQELLNACLKDKPLIVACSNREQAKKSVAKLLSGIDSLELDKTTTIQALVKQGSLLLKIPLTKGMEFRTPMEQALRTLFGLAIKERFYKKVDRFKIELIE